MGNFIEELHYGNINPLDRNTRQNKTMQEQKAILTTSEAQPITMEVNGKLFEGAQALENMTLFLRKEELKDTEYLNGEHLHEDTSVMTENAEVVWDAHGWTRTHEFLERIPIPEDDGNYILLIRHPKESICNTLAYPMILLGKLISMGYKADHLHCFSYDDSNDGLNHVTLLRRK